MAIWDSQKGDVTLDGYPIGATTPSTGAFTSLAATTATIGTPTFTNPAVRGVATGLTASTTQTLAGALALTKEINIVATSANSGDAVKLPALSAGQIVSVFNAGANPIKVFPAAADVAIDGGTAGASVTLTNAKRAQFIAVSATAIVSAQFGVASA